MIKSSRVRLCGSGSICILLSFALCQMGWTRPRGSATKPEPSPRLSPLQAARQDDSVTAKPAPDLLLRPEGNRKAQALVEFVRGATLEENGEVDKALEAYRHVLNVDPGQADLASRVATLLIRDDDFPQAIDVLKDAIKASPRAAEPYLQLSLIYAKYLHKPQQAIEYAERAITLEPDNIDAYQRLCEIEIASGDEAKALQALDRATKAKSDDPSFWTRLGKLYAGVIFKPDTTPNANDINRVNTIFKRATEHANDDPGVLKEIADYYASSQQLSEAIPLYLRVLELQPDDASAQEKLASGFVLTNQRAKAIDLLQSIIKEHPEKYQSYDLLAQVLDDQARALERENKREEARSTFAKAAANYEQSLLINPSHLNTYVRLADLDIGPLKNPVSAVHVLTEARSRFPDAPELIYYLALAQREAKHAEQAVATFEEALRQAEIQGNELANARFYFDYGATAEQAGLYEKAADLFKKSIELDPGNAAEAYNYLAYMWAEQNTHLEEAEDLIKHALEADPGNGAYLDSLGWIKFRQAKFDEALVDLQKAAQNLKRDDPVVFEHLGDTYAKLSRASLALEAWQRALALDPHNKALADKVDNAKTKMSKSNTPPSNLQ
jgi:tetratricopeptide (TPR) repeat protein